MANFQQPGISNPEDKFVPSENLGALLLFFPTQLQEKIKTAHGEADAVAATVVRLNDGRVYDNALIFPTALVTQLKGAIPDGMVLGTLGQGENTKGNAPWLLQPHTEADVAVAEQWLAANPRNAYAQPAPPTAAAPAPAWGQQPSTPASAAPATGGWGNPPAQQAPAGNGWGSQQNPPAAPTGGWQAPAAAVGAPAAPAPAPTATVDPDLVAALARKGVPQAAYQDQARAEQLWALVQNNPDVA